MKTLSLTETQRLQIEFFVMSREGNVGAVRMWIKIAEAVALPPERKESLNVRPTSNGMGWQWGMSNTGTPIPMGGERQDVILDDDHCAKLKEALVNHPGWSPMRDPPWLEPLLEQL